VKRGLAIAAFGVAVIAMRCWVLPRILPTDTITYRGETIRLSKHYFDFDDYKSDPEHIALGERARVARLVREAPIAKDFRSRAEMIRATFGIRFPGYGQTQFGQIREPDGSVIAAYSVEVPTTGEDRIFVFRGVGESYTLLDDFITPPDLGILHLLNENGTLVFSNFEGQEVLRRSLPSKR
jgi:hypothetical protein